LYHTGIIPLQLFKLCRSFAAPLPTLQLCNTPRDLRNSTCCLAIGQFLHSRACDNTRSSQQHSLQGALSQHRQQH
jgi:hypothetical protein